MNQVTSQDGTKIAFDQSGSGPAVILVGGALSDRSSAGELSGLLAPHLTVISFDRRGRGDSGDTPPYAVAREIQDIQALIAYAGDAAFLYGMSSGAVLALETANRLPAQVKKLAMYEPPFVVDHSRTPIPADYVRQLTDLVAAGRHGDAVEYFMTRAVDVPPEFMPQMKSSPMWSGMEKVAHTLAYDGMIMGSNMGGNPLPAQWANATMPILVMDGGASPDWMRHSAQSVAGVLPNAQYRTLEGQTHGVDPKVLAPVLIEFFTR